MKHPSKSTRADRNRQTIAGVRKPLAGDPPIAVDGVTYTAADIERILQASIDTTDATTAATAVFHKAVAAERAAHAEGDALDRGLRTLLLHRYLSSPDTLADFGVTPPQRQTPSAVTVADAVAKRAATRLARHTMGKRQKAGIKGEVAAANATTATTATDATTPRDPP
jgi:hypothetical protein